MAFEVPHKHDISLDGQEMRNQMIENFEAIEQYFLDINKELASYNDHISKLERNSATHDEVKQVSQEWHDRTSHIARGTDIATTRAVVEQILHEKGMI